MKKVSLTILALLYWFNLFGQDIVGQWNGILKVQNIQLRLVIHISHTDTGFISTMDSPDQGAKDIPVNVTTFENSTLNIEITSLRAKYQGTLNEDGVIKGTFNQAGQSFSLNLSKEISEKEVLVRPQEPSEPYPYYSEEVVFPNDEDDIQLSGTLTLPSEEGVHPIVVLITGSGPQNRDEELLGHKPFLVIADHLTRNGIGVLRYDDRGVGASSGDFSLATSANFATDVQSAITYLKSRKDVDNNNIGLVGHSEGGLIAPIVASTSEDVGFIVLLAGPGITGYEIILLQSELIGLASGVNKAELEDQISISKGALDIVVMLDDVELISQSLQDYFEKVISEDPSFNVPEGITKDDFINSQVESLSTPWIKYFLEYDPAIGLQKVKCPVLAINGEKDLQVPPKVNLEAIEKYLKEGGNDQVTIVELSNLNHLFQECDTGAPGEYAQIEQTFSPIALNEISNWILKQIK